MPGAALVVGGTGMLRGATLELARRGLAVSVVARDEARLAALGPDVAGIAVDYTDGDALAAALAPVAASADLELAVVWTHGAEPALAVARLLGAGGGGGGGAFVRVCGSGAAAPGAADDSGAFEEALGGAWEYRRVVLGWTDGGWLTHAEISGGVLGLLDAGVGGVVGRVRPWEERP